MKMAGGSNCRSSSPSHYLPHPISPSVPKVELVHINTISPTTSPHINSLTQIVKLENNTLSCDASLSCDSDNTFGCISITSIPTYSTSAPQKSSTELRKEIATLESEILCLERCLLSLYRTAFKEHLPTMSNVSRNDSRCKTGSPSQVAIDQSHNNLNLQTQGGGVINHDQCSPSNGWVSSVCTDHQVCSASLHSTSIKDRKKADSGRCSLAHLLGASCLVNNTFATPDMLSEDIVRCISSIYCRIANPSDSQRILTSPASSLSSSSIFSSLNPSDAWSPHHSEDDVAHRQNQVLKEERGPYAGMMEVLKICLDDDSFNYAAVMLKNFRSMVRNLEKVDPRKMKREEKLAFWINIHNALIMHAYLAYGDHNRVKSASILKAAYNVGGQCINACVIQNSIFGIRSHYPEPWLQTLFSPGRKFNAGSIRHVYALEYPEPLVHFALCSGTYSDPAVRIYTAKNIFQELKLAKEEFIQARVGIHKGAKVVLPKILSYFAKDMSMDVCGLMEVVRGCMTQVQQKAMRKCMKGKPDKYIHWLPQSSTFRYLIHKNMAKGGEGRPLPDLPPSLYL